MRFETSNVPTTYLFHLVRSLILLLVPQQQLPLALQNNAVLVKKLWTYETLN